MQLFEAVILLLVGMVAGVLVTVFDIYAVGSAAFLTHLSLWVFLNVLLASNVRRRRSAVLGAIPLNLGLIDTYYLMSSFTFEGLKRSLAAPLALLSLVAAGIALAAWTAKGVRGLLGLALSLLVAIMTLVASVIANNALTLLDLVWAGLSVLVLVGIPSLELDVLPADGRGEPSAAAAAPASEGRPARRRAPRRSARQGRGEGHAPERREGQRRQRRRPAQPERQRSPQGGYPTRGERPSAATAGERSRQQGQQHPTRRTGGAVPEARRIRTGQEGTRGHNKGQVSGVNTLGTSRQPRPSRRSDARRGTGSQGRGHTRNDRGDRR